MKLITLILKDKMMAAGLILISISFSLFVFSIHMEHQNGSGLFLINYVLAGSYLLAVFITASDVGRSAAKKGRIEYTVLMLVLFFISAFALNREMNVFNDAVDWLCVWLIMSCAVLVISPFYKVLSPLVNALIFFFMGSAFILFLYYAVYLLPLYAISVPGLIAIGISVHTYIPALLAIITSVIMLRACRADKILYHSCAAGMIVPLIIAAVYLTCWNNLNHKIDIILNQNALNEDKLPAWVAVSQQIEKSPVTEQLFKVGLVYSEANADNIFWGGVPSRSYDEPKKHDPLVTIATLLFKRPNLDEKERINILKSMYDGRQHAQERLWAGDKLETVSVISNVKLFPEYRMAYTEKTLMVKNTARYGWLSNEAIYTFHLSEGSVISSLSLWIDGKEVPSRLTTKNKADSAYRQIVGAERHDPSLVHWQEGNTVSVRVFPCNINENRKVRLGITSPLRKEGNRLIYENVYFDGPEAKHALETVRVAFSQSPAELKLPETFKKTGSEAYQADRDYQPYWEVSCAAPLLAVTDFTFNKQGYQLKNYQPACEHFEPAAVYLDINSAWSEAEFKQVWDKVMPYKVYVYHDKLVRLNKGNASEEFQFLSKSNFSLFPLQAITHPEQSLMISKSTGVSPNLRDIDGSEFANDLANYLKSSPQIRLFNIGHELNPYLKASKEFRVIRYDEGSVNGLSKLLHEKQFVQEAENDSTVVIANAGMMITKTDSTASGNAPDHLLRLFAYNDIMTKTGPNYFNNTYVQPGLLAEASQAHIVSPVSSLIVLETQEDYKRFGIDESKNSLKNASMKSSGSVPEPKEWMLVVICFLVLVYLIHVSSFKNRGLDAGY